MKHLFKRFGIIALTAVMAFAVISLTGCDNGSSGSFDGSFNPDDPVISRTITVTSKADSGAGSLRQALANAKNGDLITINLDGDKTIKLTRGVIIFDKAISITIEGNGSILDGSLIGAGGSIIYDSARLLSIANAGASITIRRLHFAGGSEYPTGGTSTVGGGAVLNKGSLVLESCIFSHNDSLSGGAIYSNGTLSVSSCTFYKTNSPSNGKGSAIYNAGTLNMGACLFWMINYSDKYSTIMQYIDIVHNASGSVFNNRGFNITDQDS
ncbi:MAG: hypothetical protein FWD78_12125 [Treponema sp.]|nr:hypothetical protein [Treponema sp.]